MKTHVEINSLKSESSARKPLVLGFDMVRCEIPASLSLLRCQHLRCPARVKTLPAVGLVAETHRIGFKLKLRKEPLKFL